MSLTFLGTSAAWPTPRPGCRCPQCAEARSNRRFARTRSGLLVQTPEEVVLIDAGPDVWHQFEREGLAPRVDRVLITHTHADHFFGLDDLVRLRDDHRERPLRVHAAPYHQARILEAFGHLTRGPRPWIVLDDWRPGSRLEVGEIVLEGFETGHRDRFPTTAPLVTLPGGGTPLQVAVATDMGEVPPASQERLLDIDLFVGDGTFLGAGGHGHPGTDAVIRLGEALGVRRIAFTHLGHFELTDADLRARLGPDVGLAYDGTTLVDLLGD